MCLLVGVHVFLHLGGKPGASEEAQDRVRARRQRVIQLANQEGQPARPEVAHHITLALPAGIDHSDQHALPTQRLDHVLRASRIVAQEQDTRDAAVLRQCRENRRDLISPHDHDGEVVGILGPEPIHQWNQCGSAPACSGILQHDAVFAQIR